MPNVFSFFDSSEINKSDSCKSGATSPRSNNSYSALEATSSSPASQTSSSSGSVNSSKNSTGVSPASSARSSKSSKPPSPNNKSSLKGGKPPKSPAKMLGKSNSDDVSTNYEDCDASSQVTERAGNISPIAHAPANVGLIRSVSNASCTAMSGMSGGSSLSTGSGLSGDRRPSEEDISKSSSGFETSNNGRQDSRDSPATNGLSIREANYEEGASELFLLVEGAAWEEAITRVNSYPEEARVWINSSGTENTVFSWSVWRRLPLHEACRRQPPPVLIYALLAAYPESASAESHFGELPLHAAVRCGACAEVVNCLLAAYPSAVFARDNSGCTPLDILNGTGKMMDHDAVIAALTRTISVLTKEEEERNTQIQSMKDEFELAKQQQQKEFERTVDTKKGEIGALQRELEQEKLATSNLAKKVIQTEKVVELKSTLEGRYQERLKKCEEDIKTLKNLNAQRKAKIKEMECATANDKKSIEVLNSRVEQLQAQFTAVVDEEETFAATTVARAELQMKVLMKAQLSFIREHDKQKERLRSRVGQLGITVPPKKFPSDFDEAFPHIGFVRDTDVGEPSDEEVAEKAMAAAMAQFSSSEDGSNDS